MPKCPVCAIDQHADDLAFSYHVNSHFDRPGTGGGDGWRDDSGASHARRTSQGGGRGIRGDPVLVDDSGTDEVNCPMCDYPFAGLGAQERQRHVEGCIDARPCTPGAEPDFDTSRTKEGDYQPADDDYVDASWDGPAKPGGWQDWIDRKVERGDHWWDPLAAEDAEAPKNFSPGLIPVLRRMLDTSVRNGSTRKAVLARDTVNIRGVWGFDIGWGCGYRNALMLLSSLVLNDPAYARRFARDVNGADPGIRRIQGWIQEAWASGFDPEGCEQFKGKLLGTRKWIGTSDLYAMFTYKGIPCQLVDFPKSSSSSQRAAHEALVEWVKRYFDEGSNLEPPRPPLNGRPVNAFDLLMRSEEEGSGAVKLSNRYPLVLQHSGHSRTIVGYEQLPSGQINLLLFDPARRSVPTDIRNAGLEAHSSRLGATPLRSSPSIRRVPHQTIRKPSHESIGFSPPYTNGDSEVVHMPQGVQSGREPMRMEGGAEEDEEMDEDGWVRKRIRKVSQSIRKSDSNGTLGSNGAPPAKIAKGPRPWEGSGVGKGIGYFRVNVASITNSHSAYQILVVTGGPRLSEGERDRRKILRSTVVR